MKQYSDLEYLRLSKWQRFCHKLIAFFCAIPHAIASFFINIGKAVKTFFLKVGAEFKDIGLTFVQGDWKTKASFLVMGFGNLANGQILRGLLSCRPGSLPFPQAQT